MVIFLHLIKKGNSNELCNGRLPGLLKSILALKILVKTRFNSSSSSELYQLNKLASPICVFFFFFIKHKIYFPSIKLISCFIPIIFSKLNTTFQNLETLVTQISDDLFGQLMNLLSRSSENNLISN